MFVWLFFFPFLFPVLNPLLAYLYLALRDVVSSVDGIAVQPRYSCDQKRNRDLLEDKVNGSPLGILINWIYNSYRAIILIISLLSDVLGVNLD